MAPLPHPGTLLRPPPLWREGRTALELATLLRHPLYRAVDAQAGRGKPVLLIPGFLAGDDTLGRMHHWLGRQGFSPRGAGMRANVDCSEASIGRLETRLERLVERNEGKKAAIIGHSRGGMYARVLAVRRPDLVDSIVGLGSPLVTPLAVHPLVLGQVLLVGALGSLVRGRGMFGNGCITGDCCEDFWHDLHGPFPESVTFTSVYSKNDGVVRWRSCLDPAAQHVEVDASHCGMAFHVDAYRAIAEAIAPALRRRRPASPSAKRPLRVAA